MKCKKPKYSFAENLTNVYLYYITISLFFISISFVSIYILAFYLGKPVDSYLLLGANDIGYTQPGYISTRVLGVHKFGDLQTQLSSVLSSNPFNVKLEFPSPYPPLALIALKPLAHLPIGIVVVTFAALSVFLNAMAFFRYFNNRNHFENVIGFMLLVILTRPFLLGLDRGNIQTLMIPMMIFVIIFYKNKNYFGAASTVVFLSCLKLYPILLLLPLLKLRKIKLFAISITSFIFINVISFQFYAINNLQDGIKGLLKGIAVQSGYGTSGLGWGAYIFRILEAAGLYSHKQGYDSVISSVSAIIALTVISIFAYRYIIKDKINFEDGIWLIMILQTCLVTVSWAYNAIWVGYLIYERIGESVNTQHLSRQREVKHLKVDMPNVLMMIAISPLPLIWNGGTRVIVTHTEMLLPVTLLFLFLKISYKKVHEI